MESYVQTIEQALGDKRSVREELQGQVHQLEVEIARLEGALDVLSGKTYPAERASRSRASQADGAEASGRAALQGAKRTRQKNGYARQVAYDLLQTKGEEGMHIRELLSALEEQGRPRRARPSGLASSRSSRATRASSATSPRPIGSPPRPRPGRSTVPDGGRDRHRRPPTGTTPTVPHHTGRHT
jgi:hypothetical protein